VHGADKTRDGEWEGEADMHGVKNRSVLTAAAGRYATNFISVTEADYITTALH